MFQTLLSSQKSPVSSLYCKFPRAEGRKHTSDHSVSPQSNVFHSAVRGKQPGVSEEGHAPPDPTPTPPKNELQKWLREVMTHGSGAKDTDGINPAFVTNEISITISTRVTNRRVRN